MAEVEAQRAREDQPIHAAVAHDDDGVRGMTGRQICDGEIDAVAEGVEPFPLRKRYVDGRLHPVTPDVRVPIGYLVVGQALEETEVDLAQPVVDHERRGDPKGPRAVERPCLRARIDRHRCQTLEQTTGLPHLAPAFV